MSKSKSGKSKSKSFLAVTLEPAIAEEETPAEPRFLTEDTLRLWKLWDKKQSPRHAVPPHTPNSEYDFDNGLQQLPRPFPDLTELEVPYVRDTGVKCCIDCLGAYFGCTDYKFNMLQFWFLDILTDCLWTAQDDFRLPVEQQKIVLAWVLYLIDLLRDSQQNMSRKKFFTVFKEVMLVAAEVVDEGCETVPLPEKLFNLIQEDEQSETWPSSDSGSSSSSLEITPEDFDNISCIELEINEKKRRYQLPADTCGCYKYDLSSVDSIPESELPSKKSTVEEESTNFQVEEEQENEEEKQEEELEEVLFYQPNLGVPSRFFIQSEGAMKEEEQEEEEETEKTKKPKPMCKIQMNYHPHHEDQISQTELNNYHVSEVADQFSIKRTSEVSSESTDDAGKLTKSSSPSSDAGSYQNQSKKRSTLSSVSKSLKQNELVQKYKDKQVIKGLAFQKLWEQRLTDMQNPKKGWIPTDAIETATKDVEDADEEDEQETSEENNVSDDDDWVDVVLKNYKHEVQQDEDKLIVNFAVLRAIIDFVFKYFYESFQFSLIKLAFQATPDIICQKVNREWMVPKKIKGELLKPKVQQPKIKKEKKKKEKKDKAPKKGKAAKDKSSKKTDRKDKKDKGSKKSKGSKKEKGKKAKPRPLTKEEKEELERQRQEQARKDEEMRKVEENKRFMFPLTDAATDDLFQGIFENWVKIDLTKKDKGKFKDKKKKGKK